MLTPDALRAKAQELLASAITPADIKAAAEIAELATKLEANEVSSKKLLSETRKLDHDLLQITKKEREDSRRYYFSLATPAITTVVLALTLALQAYQAIRADSQRIEEAIRQREAAEDQRWKDTLGILQPNNVLTAALLRDFAASPRYRDKARALAWDSVGKTENPELFQALLVSTLSPLSWEEFPLILSIHNSNIAKFQSVYLKQLAGKDPLTTEELSLYDRYLRMGAASSREIAQLIRTARKSTTQLSLQNVSIWDVDLSGSNLRAVDIRSCGMTRIDLSGANLSDIVDYEGATLKDTTWWRAQSISPKLLQYLLATAPFDPAAKYPGPKATRAEFDAAVAKLSSH